MDLEITPSMEAAIERILTLQKFTKQSGTLTNKVQGRILGTFTPAQQEYIVTAVMVRPSALAGGN